MRDRLGKVTVAFHHEEADCHHVRVENPGQHLDFDLARTVAGLIRMLRRMRCDSDEAEDLAQGAVLKAIQNGPLDSPEAWLSTVAKMDWFALRRKRRRRAGLLGRPVDLAEVPCYVDPSAEVDRCEANEVVQAAVDQLPPDLQPVIVWWMDGTTFKTIAAELGVHEKMVSRRFRRALRRLKEILERGPQWNNSVVFPVTPRASR